VKGGNAQFGLSGGHVGQQGEVVVGEHSSLTSGAGMARGFWGYGCYVAQCMSYYICRDV
jgi:hypothetical protein